MAQNFAEQITAMDLNTKRLKKMNEEINRVTNDLKMLNRLTKIDSYGLSRDSSADIALKHVRSSPGIDLLKNKQGVNINFKNLSKMDYSQSQEQVERLPQIQPRKGADQSALYSKDVTASPSVKLQSYISKGSKDSLFFQDMYGREESPKPSQAETYLSKGYNSNQLQLKNAHSHKPSEIKYENQVYDGGYPVKPKGLYEPKEYPSYSSKAPKSEFSPFESAKILKQKILSKDAVLTNSILMQQKSQHHLNKSIRNTQISNQIRYNSESAYIDDTLKKNYIREPQTASTGVFSSGGLSNKIEPPYKDLKYQGSAEQIPSYDNSINGYRFLPSVGKNKEELDRGRKLTEVPKYRTGDADFHIEKIMKRRGTNNFLSLGSNPISEPKKTYQDSNIQSNWIKLDWNIPTSEKVDIISEFRLDKVLGRGNSSIVHKAIDLKLNLPVAVKILEKSSVKETYLRDMLQKEIDIASRLDHPNIARLFRVLQDGCKVYLVQEYCGSQTLSQYADHKRISENKAKSIFKQVAGAVAFIHSQGYAHRDLKFSNILISELGVVKLVDFGFACDGSKRQRIFCGTPSYMPPELIKKKEYIPTSVDVWSLGVILFKLIAHSYPFGACNDKDLEQRIDGLKYNLPASIKPEIKNLLENLLCHNPAERLKADLILRHPWLSG